MPEEMRLKAVEIVNEKAILEFQYNGKIVYFIQEQRVNEVSAGLNSDKSILEDPIHNDWISEFFMVENPICIQSLDPAFKSIEMNIFQ